MPSPYYTARGVVLRNYRLGEADRIVVLLTAERGMVRAVAKGVRKTRSKFGARLEPTSNVQLQLHEGRGELQLITQAESIEQFRSVREDLDRLTKAMSMLEATDQVALPDQPAPQLYRMLVGALRALESENSALVAAGFFLKLLALEGSAPEVAGCVVCARSDELVALSEPDGGLVCSDHRRGRPVGPQAVALLQDILGGRLGSALNEPASAATAEVQSVATGAIERFLERRMKSTTVLES